MKTIRTWIYAILKYKENIVVILKKRWPFTGLYDLPGGKIEHWENHISALKRELEEEAQLSANEWKKVVDLVPTPGYCNEKIHLYEAKGIQHLENAAPLDEDEFVSIEWIPVEEVIQKIHNGEITDAKTIIAVQYAALHQ